MVTLSEVNKIRLQAITILAITHLFIIFLLPADKQFKINLSATVIFFTALFILLRGRSLKRKKQIEELL